jgi:hypothetical protein
LKRTLPIGPLGEELRGLKHQQHRQKDGRDDPGQSGDFHELELTDLREDAAES